jgi:hypothetical protein
MRCVACDRSMICDREGLTSWDVQAANGYWLVPGSSGNSTDAAVLASTFISREQARAVSDSAQSPVIFSCLQPSNCRAGTFSLCVFSSATCSSLLLLLLCRHLCRQPRGPAMCTVQGRLHKCVAGGLMVHFLRSELPISHVCFSCCAVRHVRRKQALKPPLLCSSLW